MEEYIKKLENDLKWLLQCELRRRESELLLIKMIESLLADWSLSHCQPFRELLQLVKTSSDPHGVDMALGSSLLSPLSDLSECKAHHEPIREQKRMEPSSHAGIILDPTDGEIASPAWVKAAKERLQADEEE